MMTSLERCARLVRALDEEARIVLKTRSAGFNEIEFVVEVFDSADERICMRTAAKSPEEAIGALASELEAVAQRLRVGLAAFDGKDEA